MPRYAVADGVQFNHPLINRGMDEQLTVLEWIVLALLVGLVALAVALDEDVHGDSPGHRFHHDQESGS
jgi:hypothetical protein